MTKPSRHSGDSTAYSDNGTRLYPDAFTIGSYDRKLDICILNEPGKRHEARFVFEISGSLKDGEIHQPTERRSGIYLAASEPITIAEARELGKWLSRKARHYERPAGRLLKFIRKLRF